MDEREKQEIRRDNQRRFWGVLIIMPLLSGLFIWWWLSTERHGQFYFLTILPLLFMIPLLRYNLTVRTLTEPESGAGELKSFISADGAFKAQIRKKAKRRFVASVIACVLLAGLAFGLVSGEARVIFHSQRRLKLIDKSSAVWNESWRFSVERGKELALFPPPPATSRRGE